MALSSTLHWTSPRQTAHRQSLPPHHAEDWIGKMLVEEIWHVVSTRERVDQNRECWVRIESEVGQGKGQNGRDHEHPWTCAGVAWSSICRIQRRKE